MLFGSDLPALTPDRWLADFATLEFPAEAVQAIVKDNAVRLLGLT
jgi:predicted TIM-barrel fold metal-dependent hydrolase